MLAKLEKGYVSEWMILNSKHKTPYSDNNDQLNNRMMSSNCLTTSLHGSDLWLGSPVDHELTRSWRWKRSILGHTNRRTVWKMQKEIMHYYDFGFFQFWTLLSRRTQSETQTIAENPEQGHEKELTKCRTYTKNWEN